MGFLTSKNTLLTSHFDKARYHLAWRISVLFSILFAVLSVLFLLCDVEIFNYYFLTFSIVISTLFYLKIKKKYTVPFLIYAVSGTILIHTSLNFSLDGFADYVNFLWMILVILLTFFGLGVTKGIVIMCLNILGIIWYVFFTLNSNVAIASPLSFQRQITLIIEFIFAVSSIGYVVIQFVRLQQFAEQKMSAANNSLRAKNAIIKLKNTENETLLKEIHHRVKNNLQIIVSLLSLQKKELKSKESKDHFDDAINRIMSISLIHEKLYQENGLGSTTIKSYLEDLSNSVIKSSNIQHSISLKIDSEINTVGLKTIIPFGLLINELLANSMKYAFRHKTKGGTIIIKIKKGKESYFTVTYSDNGTWLERKNNKRFGLKLIEILTYQLKGTVERDNSTYIFSLKNIDV